jgi:hypothetical protein
LGLAPGKRIAERHAQAARGDPFSGKAQFLCCGADTNEAQKQQCHAQISVAGREYE